MKAQQGRAEHKPNSDEPRLYYHMKRSQAKDPPRFGNKKTKEVGFMKII
jgi:hypothetical protein